jgi:hypothetical protein
MKKSKDTAKQPQDNNRNYAVTYMGEFLRSAIRKPASWVDWIMRVAAVVSVVIFVFLPTAFGKMNAVIFWICVTVFGYAALVYVPYSLWRGKAIRVDAIENELRPQLLFKTPIEMAASQDSLRYTTMFWVGIENRGVANIERVTLKMLELSAGIPSYMFPLIMQMKHDNKAPYELSNGSPLRGGESASYGIVHMRRGESNWRLYHVTRGAEVWIPPGRYEATLAVYGDNTPPRHAKLVFGMDEEQNAYCNVEPFQ